MKIRHKVVLDLLKRTHIEVEIARCSRDTVVLEIFLLENGKKFDMTQAGAVSFKAVKPDGSIVFNDVDGILADGKVEYTISESILEAAGRTVCEIQLIGQEDDVITSFEFYILVRPMLFDENEYVSENELSGFRSYMIRAENAAKQSEGIKNMMEVTYGTMDEIIGDLNGVKEEYVTYMEELQQKVENGEFNGQRGPQGENGADAVVVEAKGLMGFQIVEGDLWCYYYGDTPPDLAINESGELVYEF